MYTLGATSTSLRSIPTWVHYEPLCRSGCFCYYELAVYIRHDTDIGSFDNDGGTDGRLAVTNYDSTRYALSLCKDHYTA